MLHLLHALNVYFPTIVLSKINLEMGLDYELLLNWWWHIKCWILKIKMLVYEAYEDYQIIKARVTSKTFCLYFVTTQFISILYFNFYIHIYLLVILYLRCFSFCEIYSICNAHILNILIQISISQFMQLLSLSIKSSVKNKVWCYQTFFNLMFIF